MIVLSCCFSLGFAAPSKSEEEQEATPKTDDADKPGDQTEANASEATDGAFVLGGNTSSDFSFAAIAAKSSGGFGFGNTSK